MDRLSTVDQRGISNPSSGSLDRVRTVIAPVNRVQDRIWGPRPRAAGLYSLNMDVSESDRRNLGGKWAFSIHQMHSLAPTPRPATKKPCLISFLHENILFLALVVRLHPGHLGNSRKTCFFERPRLQVGQDTSPGRRRPSRAHVTKVPRSTPNHSRIETPVFQSRHECLAAPKAD